MKIRQIIDWADNCDYDFSFHGDDSVEITGFSSLENCKEGNIVWIKKRELFDSLSERSAITLGVVQKGLDLDIPNQFISSNSKELFFAILHHFWGKKPKRGSIGLGTYISPEAVIDPTVIIGFNCTIDGKVNIGADTIIENNVVIQGNVTIGHRCHIQSQVVIGIDGFGYSKDYSTGKKTMIEHFGGVRIGDDVFIASHVNIARGTLDDTTIADGVKIAPSTHIGHNNNIGENAIIICSNLFGSVTTGKDAYIVASTVQNQSRVGVHSVVGMGSIVTKPVEDNVIAFGVPAKTVKENNSDL